MIVLQHFIINNIIQQLSRLTSMSVEHSIQKQAHKNVVLAPKQLNQKESAQNSTQQKNETDKNHKNVSGWLRLKEGIAKISQTIDLTGGIDELFINFSNYSCDQSSQFNPGQQLSVKNNKNQPESAPSLTQIKIQQNIQQKPTYKNYSKLQSILDNIFTIIQIKNKQAIQQFDKFDKKQSLDIFTVITVKTVESLEDLSMGFKNIQINYQMSEQLMGTSIFHQINGVNAKPRVVSEENQFIDSDFGQHHNIQQIQDYVKGLENVEQKNIKKKQNREEHIKQFCKLLQKCCNQKFKIGKIRESEQESPVKQGQRANSGALSQRMSSAQSQRLRSAASNKNSENDDSFNLDLTVKTRNSKNLYQIARQQDSLLYSADSGFGFQPESPNKMHGTRQEFLDKKDEKNWLSGINQIQDDHEDRTKQAINLKKTESILLTESQYKNQSEGDQPIKNNHSNIESKNKHKKNNQQTYKKDFNSRIQDNRKNKKIQKSEPDFQYQRSSVRQGTIIDKMQNFDADDEDENNQFKQLHQSVHLSKKKSSHADIRKRVETQATKIVKEQKNQNNSLKNMKRFNKIDIAKLEQAQNVKSREKTEGLSHNASNSNIFATQIQGYQKKISKLKEDKEQRKRLLQKELAKINDEIIVLNRKEDQFSPQNKNNFASRLKISQNNEAKKNAEKLVKNLRSQKRNRNLAKIGQFSNLDKNINEYMEELTQLRAQNEEKNKHKKKLQILQRMKQNQFRKLKQKKKITQNQQFVLQLKGALPNQHEAIRNSAKQEIKQQPLSKRSPTKQQEQEQIEISSNMTPQLNQKKAFLNKIRSFSVKKQTRDPYEQALN